jgi:hypothetical protein
MFQTQAGTVIFRAWWRSERVLVVRTWDNGCGNYIGTGGNPANI